MQRLKRESRHRSWRGARQRCERGKKSSAREAGCTPSICSAVSARSPSLDSHASPRMGRHDSPQRASLPAPLDNPRVNALLLGLPRSSESSPFRNLGSEAKHVAGRAWARGNILARTRVVGHGDWSKMNQGQGDGAGSGRKRRAGSCGTREGEWRIARKVNGRGQRVDLVVYNTGWGKSATGGWPVLRGSTGNKVLTNPTSTDGAQKGWSDRSERGRRPLTASVGRHGIGTA